MSEKTKIEQAIKEIGFCSELKVKIADGMIVAICKGRYERPKRNGVKTEIIVEEDIT